MAELLKIPLILTQSPDGGYTVTSPVLPELVTEGDTVEEAVENVRDAVKAVLEIYEDQGRTLPADLRLDPHGEAIRFECLLASA